MADHGPRLYAHNAAAMWASLAPWARPLPGPPEVAAVEVPAQPATRVVLRGPLAQDPAGHIGGVLAGAARAGPVTVEDSFGGLDLAVADGVTALRLPVMVRPAAPAPANRPAGGTAVHPAGSEAALVVAERVIVDGFPKPALKPFQPGRVLPSLILGRPGWQVWLACCDGEPAAACACYDDGTAAGIYWLATLPAFRSRGLGRAVVTAALAAHPDRPVTLVATAAGQPLYASLGFQTVSQALWYRTASAASASRRGD